jgi:hypothetical protein
VARLLKWTTADAQAMQAEDMVRMGGTDRVWLERRFRVDVEGSVVKVRSEVRLRR